MVKENKIIVNIIDLEKGDELIISAPKIYNEEMADFSKKFTNFLKNNHRYFFINKDIKITVIRGQLEDEKIK